MVPRPSGFVGPVPELGDGGKMFMDVTGQDRAIRFSENPQSVLAGIGAAGDEHGIDAVFLDLGDDRAFLFGRDLDVVEENELARRRTPVGQVIIQAVIGQGKK